MSNQTYNDENKHVDIDEETETASKNHKRHRGSRRRIIGMVAGALLIIAVFVVCFTRVKSTYNSYTVKSSVARNDNSAVHYVALEDGYISFGHDGAAKYSYKGAKEWEQTYEINNPVIDRCGNYIAVADIGGNLVYVFDKEGYVNTVNTALPIIQMNVSGDGYVVASLEDARATFINMYGPDNEKIYSIKTVIEGDGFPVSIAVSPSTNLLMVSYSAVKQTEFSNSVVFYNFDEVGQNEVERVVAGFDGYKDKVVSKVDFISGNRAIAYGENTISIFSVDEYPKLLKEIDVESPIKKVFYSDKYVGYTYAAGDGKDGVMIYSEDGKLISENTIDDDYSDIAFVEDKVMMYGNNSFAITKLNGKTVFDKTLEEGIVALMPISGENKYLYVSGNKIQYIELKHGG